MPEPTRIDKAFLLQELKGLIERQKELAAKADRLTAEREQTLADINAVNGAIQTTRFYISKIEQVEKLHGEKPPDGKVPEPQAQTLQFQKKATPSQPKKPEQEPEQKDDNKTDSQ